MTGAIRGGRFVDGFTGEQFAARVPAVLGNRVAHVEGVPVADDVRGAHGARVG